MKAKEEEELDDEDDDVVFTAPQSALAEEGVPSKSPVILCFFDPLIYGLNFLQ